MYCGIIGVCSYFTEKSTLWNNKREVGLFLRVDLFLGDYDVKRVDDVQAKPMCGSADNANTFLCMYNILIILYTYPLKLQQSKQKV